METQREALFATADEVRGDFTVFTEEALRNMAARDSRCRYDEQARQLWIKIETWEPLETAIVPPEF